MHITIIASIFNNGKYSVFHSLFILFFFAGFCLKSIPFVYHDIFVKIILKNVHVLHAIYTPVECLNHTIIYTVFNLSSIARFFMDPMDLRVRVSFILFIWDRDCFWHKRKYKLILDGCFYCTFYIFPLNG